MPDRRSAVGAFTSSLLAFLAPGAAVVGTAVLVTSESGTTITAGEWVAAAVAAVVTGAAIESQVARRIKVEEHRLLEAALSPPPDQPSA